MMRGSLLAGARRRFSGAPFSDDFTGGSIDTTKWPNITGAPTQTGGRLRIIPTTAYPQVVSGPVFDMTTDQVWVEVPTIPNQGNGTNKARFLLFSNPSGASNVYFQIEYNGSAWILFMHGNGTITSVSGSSTINPYVNATHRFLRFTMTGGNLLYETSADNVTWTTRRTIVAPAWLTAGLVYACLQAFYTGTEPSPGYAEFDNFRI
jgi:hypothetical protein